MQMGSHSGRIKALSPYYTMRFPCIALAVKPDANEMDMKRK